MQASLTNNLISFLL